MPFLRGGGNLGMLGSGNIYASTSIDNLRPKLTLINRSYFKATFDKYCLLGIPFLKR